MRTTKHSWLKSTVCLAFWAVLTTSVIGGEPASNVPLSGQMSFDQIERALDAYPPSFDHGDQRLAIMESLDRLITVDVKNMTEADQPRLGEIVAFYRKRVDRGLGALEKTRVTEGVHVFKFYSSSVVLRSAQGAMAVDFCQGPVQNGGEPETADLYHTGMYLTPEQRDRLARLVDVQLVTHRHHDHADYSLARRMVAAGKPVVGPAQLKKQMRTLKNYFHIPVHEYEMMHDGGGNRTAGRLKGASRKAFDAHRLMPLVWGEDFAISPQMVTGG